MHTSMNTIQMTINNFTLQTPPLVVRPQSPMPKLKETGFRQKLKKKVRRFRRKLRRQRRRWKKAFKQIWKWQRKNRKTRSKNPRKRQKKKKNRRKNNGQKNRKNKKEKKFQKTQSLVSWDAFRLKNRAWQWKLILLGHYCQFGCGILKMVGPQMQDFCPRIKMLKEIFF